MKMNNSLIGLVLAHGMLAVPLVLIVVRSALTQWKPSTVTTATTFTPE